jgi:hypothetical protein
MLMEKAGLNDYAAAKQLLIQSGSVKKAVESIHKT